MTKRNPETVNDLSRRLDPLDTDKPFGLVGVVQLPWAKLEVGSMFVRIYNRAAARRRMTSAPTSAWHHPAIDFT
jgi:hypothetical protein